MEFPVQHQRTTRRPIDGRYRLFLGVAGLFLLIGLWQATTVTTLYVRGENVIGVTQTEARKSGASVDVTFVTRAGETVSHRVNVTKALSKGDRIELVYDPKKPTRVQASDSMPAAAYLAAGLCIVPLSLAGHVIRAIRAKSPAAA